MDKDKRIAELEAALRTALDDVESLIAILKFHDAKAQTHNEEATLRKGCAALAAKEAA